MKLRRSVCGLVAGLVATGCGAGEAVVPRFTSESEGPRFSQNARHGYSLVLPAGWYRAQRNLTPELMDPREILSVASYPLRYQRRARCRIAGCPTPALNGFKATDILLSIQERARAKPTTENAAIDLKPRQRPLRAGPRSCTRGRVAWYVFDAFAQVGRNLYVFAVVGKRASAKTRADLKRVLRSLRFSPRGEPLALSQSGEGTSISMKTMSIMPQSPRGHS